MCVCVCGNWHLGPLQILFAKDCFVNIRNAEGITTHHTEPSSVSAHKISPGSP